MISILYYLAVAVTSVVFYVCALVLWLLTSLFDRRLCVLHRFSSLWASLYLLLMPAWRVQVIGRKKYNPQQAYVMVSNHQSQLDILVAFHMRCHFKFVSKAEVFRIPFIGWNMSLNRYIRLQRGRSGSIKRMFEDCEAHLKNGSSIFMFPEGTRSLTGVPRKFRGGAFALAKRAQVPVLLVAINGTKDALPKSSIFFSGRHQISIEILGEMPYAEIAEMDSGDIAEAARQRIIQALPVMPTDSNEDVEEKIG